jgi:hypothetical protein
MYARKLSDTYVMSYFTKFGVFQWIFVEVPNTKFDENPFKWESRC